MLTKCVDGQNLYVTVDVPGTPPVGSGTTYGLFLGGQVRLAPNAQLELRPTGFVSVPPAARLGGVLDLAPGSQLTVTGEAQFAFGSDPGQSGAQPILRSEVASSGYGRLVATRGVTFDPVGAPAANKVRLDVDLVGGFGPAAGARFDVAQAGAGFAVTGDVDAYYSARTPGGRVVEKGVDGTSVFAVVGAPGAAPGGPAVGAATFEYQLRQAIHFTLPGGAGGPNGPSAFLSRGDVTLVNLTTGATVPNAFGRFVYNAATGASASLVLTGLADGDYRATVAADDLGGVPVTFDFFVLAGDANRDRAVTFADLAAVAANYGAEDRTFGQGNFDYSPDGAVTFADLAIVAANYGKTLPAPRPAAGRAVRVADGVLA